MRILLILALVLGTGGAHAQPADDPVAAARLLYIEGDYAAALEVLRPAAEAGDPVAQNIMGAAHEDGNGVPKDRALAEDWYMRAAEQGFDKALFNLGLLHEDSDPQKAREWYEKAIAVGYPFAMNNLGFMYESGDLGAPDIDRAAALYRQAVDLDHVPAMNNLARLHFDGEHVARDLPLVLSLYRRAAAQGASSGLNNLGVMYDNGYAVTQDKHAAMALYHMAAAQQDPQAAVNLAYTLIEEDIGWTRPVEGYRWCLRALDWSGEGELAANTSDCDYLAGLVGPEVVAQATALHEAE